MKPDILLLDLDRPETLPAALRGITGALLLAGYSVRMLQQSKGFLEATAARGVRQILHIGASRFAGRMLRGGSARVRSADVTGSSAASGAVAETILSPVAG